jgi:hypothetical protein
MWSAADQKNEKTQQPNESSVDKGHDRRHAPNAQVRANRRACLQEQHNERKKTP